MDMNIKNSLKINRAADTSRQFSVQFQKNPDFSERHEIYFYANLFSWGYYVFLCFSPKICLAKTYLKDFSNGH